MIAYRKRVIELRRDRGRRGGLRSAEVRAAKRLAGDVPLRPPLPGTRLETWVRIDHLAGRVDQYDIFQGRRANQRDLLVNGARWHRGLSITRIMERFRKWWSARWIVG